MKRIYRLQSYMGRGLQPWMFYFTDASPCGLGRSIVAYYASAVTETDERLLGIEIGNPRSQQVLEALAILGAGRTEHRCWISNLWRRLNGRGDQRQDLKAGGTNRRAGRTNLAGTSSAVKWIFDIDHPSDFIRNTMAGTWHKMAVDGLGHPPSQWRIAVSTYPAGKNQTCDKCFHVAYRTTEDIERDGSE